MKTVNISLTAEQAKFIDKTTKTYDFANRSEFVRALIRLFSKDSTNLMQKVLKQPFATAATKILTLEEIKKKAIPILKKNDVEFAGIFGSYARGEAKPESDVDILIRYNPNDKKTLLDLVGLQDDLKKALRTQADVVTEGAVHPYIKESVKKDLINLYGQGPNL